MRYHSVRSIIRAAVTAGLVVSCNATNVSANGKEFMLPNSGACFVHDLQWEQYNDAFERKSWHDSVSSSRANIGAEPIVSPPIPEVIENERCIAAAKQFEMQRQAAAAWRAIQTKSHQFGNSGTKMLSGVFQSRHVVLQQLNAHALQLVRLIEIPETLPVSVVEQITANPELPRVSEIDAASSAASAAIDSQNVNHELAENRMVDIVEPSVPASEVTCHEVVDANSLAMSNDVYDVYASDWNCTDWNRDCNLDSRAQLPVRDQANIFVFTLSQLGEEANSQTAAGPSVEDCAISMKSLASLNSNSTSNPNWQTGMDPVCHEIHVNHYPCPWGDFAAEPSVCCPVDNVEYQTKLVDAPKIEPTQMEALVDTIPMGDSASQASVVSLEPQLPPTLDADFDTSSDAFALSSPWSNRSLASSELSEGIEASSAIPSTFDGCGPCSPSDYSKSMMFSREDLRFASELAARIVEPPRATEPTVQPFAPKDFLVERKDFASASDAIPPSSASIGFQYAMNRLWRPATQSGFTASKNIAKQIRWLGQILVEFAGKIENEAERVELATRDSNQR